MTNFASIVCNHEELQVCVNNKVYIWNIESQDMGGDALCVLLSDLGFDVELFHNDDLV